MKNKTLLIIILVFVLLLGGAYVLYNNLSGGLSMDQISSVGGGEAKPQSTAPSAPSDATEPPKIAAPEFTVYDGDGTPVRFSQFVGKPIILNFWSSNCGPCRMEMPDFQDAFERYGDQIQFLMVNVTDGSWDTRDSAGKFVEKNGFTFPVFYDTDVNAAGIYGIRSLPSTYFIDSEGYLTAYARGMLRADSLEKAIGDLLNPQK